MQPAGTFNMSYQQDMAIIRTRFQWGAFIGFLIFLLTLPLYAGDYWLSIINNIGIVIVAVLGLNILIGYCGQISIGHAAFAAIGAYTAGMLTHNLEWSAWATLPCAILTASLIGLIFGLPALRVKGFYLAMTTLAAQVMIIWFLSHGKQFGIPTGGADGLPVTRPALGNIVINTDGEFFYLIMVFVLIAVFFAKNLTRTRVGRAFVAIRDNDLAAEVMGVNQAYYKLLAFSIACAFAGLAGWLNTYYIARTFTDSYTLDHSIWWVGMLIVGGLGSTMGAIYGTVFIRLLREGALLLAPIMGSWFPAVSNQIFSSLSLIITGLVIALFIVFEPRGINHLWQRFKSYYRLLPFSY
jgi:branched-chain amino acid transport system permease protein